MTPSAYTDNHARRRAEAIPDTAIRLSYLWPCNAAMAAFNLYEAFAVKLSPSELRLLWEREVETCIALRELGERPEKGFSRDERLEMVERLVGK